MRERGVSDRPESIERAYGSVIDQTGDYVASCGVAVIPGPVNLVIAGALALYR